MKGADTSLRDDLTACGAAIRERLWYGDTKAVANAIAGNVIETQEHTGDFKRPRSIA